MSEETIQEIDQAAADWVARIDRAPLSESEQESLKAWLGEDPRQYGAYVRATVVFAHTERAKALGAHFDSANFDLAAFDFASARPARPEPLPSGFMPRRRAMWMGAGAAAAIAGAGVISYSYVLPTHYQTQRGEVRLVPMSDGSIITLNTASTVVVRYTPLRRDVRLIEGEALFDVAKDSHRPFTVTAGGTSVRAVGTSFAVRHLADTSMDVLVREGTVDVFRDDDSAASLRVPANNRTVAIKTPGGVKTVVVAVDPAAVARQLAWREGMIAFEGISLGEAVAEFGRYSDTHIVIADAAVAALPITGLFAAHNPAGFARAVASTFDLQIGQTPAGVITLRK